MNLEVSEYRFESVLQLSAGKIQAKSWVLSTWVLTNDQFGYQVSSTSFFYINVILAKAPVV